MPLLLKHQVTWSFWKENYIRWPRWEQWFAYSDFSENSACSLLFRAHATIKCCYIWPHYPLEKNVDYAPRFPSQIPYYLYSDLENRSTFKLGHKDIMSRRKVFCIKDSTLFYTYTHFSLNSTKTYPSYYIQ